LEVRVDVVSGRLPAIYENDLLDGPNANRYTGLHIRDSGLLAWYIGSPMTASLSDIAYKHIQHKLLSAAIPVGAKVSEHALSQELGISRTPVREAIRRLELEGLLRQVASSGTYVALPDRTELVDVYEVRMALEKMAIRKATRRMRPRDVLELGRFCQQMLEAVRVFRDSGQSVMDGPLLRQYLTADLAFHLLLLRTAGNRYAAKILGDVHMRTAMFGYRSHERDLHHVARIWLYHARVARAVRQRDGRTAEYWLERHIRCSLRGALAAFDARRGAPPAPPPADFAEAMESLIAQLG
jgi:DNA-binding GntR family transcriptional regulator